MLVRHGQSSMRRTEFLTSHQTCASGSQRELSASCLSPWHRGEHWAGGWTGRERSQKEGKRWVEGRDTANNPHPAWAEHPSAILPPQHSAINPWSFLWFTEQLLVLCRTAQADNYYLPGQAAASSKPPGLSATLFPSFQLIPSAFSQEKPVKINSPK